MKSVTGTHCVELQASGGMTVKRTEQEKINRLERRVMELESQLNLNKVIFDIDDVALVSTFIIEGLRSKVV